MDPASFIVSILVLGSLVVLLIFLRQRALRFQAAEELRFKMLQQQNEEDWQKGLARHRATTIGSLPPVPPSQSDPEPKA